MHDKQQEPMQTPVQTLSALTAPTPPTPSAPASAGALRAQAGGRGAAASLGFLAVLSAGPDSQPGVLNEGRSY